jgi:hypothetical protein
MSSQKVHKVGFKYKVITIALAVGSVLVLLVPIKQFKPFQSAAKYLLGASVVSFVTTRSAMRDVLDEVEATDSEHAEHVQALEKTITTLRDDKSALTVQIDGLMSDIDLLKLDAKEQLEELQTCQQALKNAFSFNAETAHRLVEECYQVGMRKAVCHIESLYRNYAECREDLGKVKLEIEAKKERFCTLIDQYNTIEGFDDLLDMGLDIQEKILTQTIELRCKAQSIVISYLLSLVEDAVPYASFEEYIENFKLAATDRILGAEERRQSDLRCVVDDFTEVIENHKTRYASDVGEAILTARQAVEQLELSRYELEEALARLSEAQKPLEFNGGSSVANIGNAISTYYYNRYGFYLDALHWEDTELGFKVVYSIRRNPGLPENELTADNSMEQVTAHTNALHGTEPKWEFNRQFSQLTLTVQLRRPTKVKVDELPRGVRKASEFLKIVKSWRRIRITGGSESGKSPTAENLICAILQQTPGHCDFYDPQFDSVKNHRTIPAVGHSHADSVQGMKDYQVKMNSEPSSSLYMAWLDEIDTTLDQHPKSASDLKAILKQSSHKNCGLVITGQNANVRNLKGGFDRSDMNNCICLHIGDNYRDAIANSHLSTPEKDGLMRTGDALTEWCATKNEQDGLDHTDPSAYRFALVLEPNKKGYFMILPEFGEYQWQADIPSEPTDAPLKVADKAPNCPTCGADSIKNGLLKTVNPPKQRWKCKSAECGREFT